MKRKHILFAAIFSVVLATVLMNTVFKKRHLALGIMIPYEVLQTQSLNYEVAGVGRRAGEFSGPTTLWIEGHKIELPRALVTYFVDAGYVTTYHALEFDGHYTRDEFVTQWLAYVDMAQALPEWREKSNTLIKALGVSPERSHRENAIAFLEHVGPRKRLGTRKLSLLRGEYTQTIKGRPFFSSLTINLTYDEDYPEHPYRFAFSQSLDAYSMDCTNWHFRNFYEQAVAGVPISEMKGLEAGRPMKPELIEAFEGWDYKDTSIETLRPFIERYVFDICEENSENWR